MPRIAKDFTGHTFGYLTVDYEILPRTKPRKWSCNCSCGASTVVIQGNLLSGTSKSCGCYRAEAARVQHTIHGGKADPLYSILQGIKTRCTNPASSNYADYGARGISMCKEWEDFTAFRDWAISNGYTQGLTIDRKDTNGNYFPDNCRWVDLQTQNRNRNKQRATSSKYIGVSWNTDKKKWIASVKCTDKRVFLGYFLTEIEGAIARDTYIKQNNLSDFVLNFP